MTALDAANIYIVANLLLLIAAIGVATLRLVSRLSANPVDYRRQLRLAYVLSAAAVLLPFAPILSPRAEVLPQNAQIWSAASMRDSTVGAGSGHRIAISSASLQVSAPLDRVRSIAAGLFLTGAATVAMLLFLETISIRRIVADAQTIARRRRVRVLSSSAVRVPFSFWLPRLHFIVLPADLVLRPADLRMALRHEAQHHRQLDTKLAYAYQLLRMLFFWNPAMHWLHKSIAELQEFACDEALIEDRKVSAHAYCSCLLRVAESALRQQRISICAGMLGAATHGVLKNRIEALLARGTMERKRAPLVAALSGAVLTLMLGMTVAFSATIQDRRIAPEQAEHMLAAARQRSSFPVLTTRQALLAVKPSSDFPLVVNERVIEQLNRLLGTSDGRAFMRESLQRMREHEAPIAGALAGYGLPPELMAVPLVESGYRNLPPGDNPRHGAGLWMFIAPTAQRFGLTVNASADERLNVAKETDAAMRMFAGLYEQFGDWGLALLAYNGGEQLVQQGLRATGSRDVWLMLERGYENDRDYVPRVMAVLLIMKNPDVLE
jgi:beta-lactamase regulating signal transducer with metallopeptidase domain